MRFAGSAGGRELLGMLEAGADRLEQYTSQIDALNVFPIPDGDTGNNMLLSMRAALKEARSVPDSSASQAAEAFARGALVGARGNSGIILSQFWQGLAQGLDGETSFTVANLSVSMQRAAVLAFQALSKPVEGTILTVIKDIAAATRHKSFERDDLISFMERVVDTARESVARTPQQLRVLRQAGVVDAGGWGLQIILEGALEYLRGGRGDFQRRSSTAETRAANLSANATRAKKTFGYCTEFLLRGDDLEPEKIRSILEDWGESLVVAGNRKIVRVHLHAEDPNSVVRRVRVMGRVDHLSIRDMDEQHEAFLQDWRKRTFETHHDEIAAIAIAPTERLADVFKSLGAHAIVMDGQNSKKGIEDLRKAIRGINNCPALVLPNDKHRMSEAEDIFNALPNQISIVPTVSIPQGVSAILAFNPGQDIESNRRLMAEAIEQVRTIEICTVGTNRVSSRSAPGDPQFVGLLEGEFAASGEDIWAVLDELMQRLDTDKAELITVYYNEHTAGTEVEGIVSNLHNNYPHLEVETVAAGRLESVFIVSLE